MSDKEDVDSGLMIIEQMNEEKREVVRVNLLEGPSTVTLTGDESVRGSTERGIEKVGSGLSELGSSLLGSFQSLNSSQSSESDKMIPYVTPLNEMKVLQFKDTLLEEDHRNFSVICDSLLFEGKVGNLTDLTLGMVLAKKPPAWLQVMHERLKHLVMSLETFKEKKKAKHIA